ncbi:MAG: DUF4097 family beta strand repeat protein [Pseudomonadales bacterium]|nr:DUF4097 family beta strand repeat protein [Pseudomonadales bacterium]
MPNLIRLFLLMTATFSAATAFGYCDASRTIRESFAAGDYTSVELNALAGGLEVRGRSGSDVIEFEGHACTDEDRYLDRLTLDIDRQDGVLKLTVIIPYNAPDFHADYATMDVILTLPADLPVSVRDSSGDLSIENAATTLIDDSSGDIRVRNARADLTILDSSGDINVRNNLGAIEIEDSSGDIYLRDTAGKVTIHRDSSGSIEITGTGADVAVENDGSGEIEIDETRGNVTIGNAGSGDITIRDAGGDVVVESHGSGHLRVENVNGALTVEHKGSGGIRTSGIGGQIRLPEYSER